MLRGCSDKSGIVYIHTYIYIYAEIAQHGFDFLKFNAECAYRAHQEGKALFLFMLNLHRLHHIFFDVRDQGNGGYVHVISASSQLPNRRGLG